VIEGRIVRARVVFFSLSGCPACGLACGAAGSGECEREAVWRILFSRNVEVDGESEDGDGDGAGIVVLIVRSDAIFHREHLREGLWRQDVDHSIS